MLVGQGQLLKVSAIATRASQVHLLTAGNPIEVCVYVLSDYFSTVEVACLIGEPSDRSAARFNKFDSATVPDITYCHLTDWLGGAPFFEL